MRKQEFGQPDSTVASSLFVEPLGGRLVHRIPRPIGLTSSYPPRRDQMAKIMKEVKRHGRRSYMRDAGALIQFAVGNKLNPEGDRIVIQAHEANIALIEIGLIESVLTGKINPLALHAQPKRDREIVVLSEQSGFEQMHPDSRCRIKRSEACGARSSRR